MKKWINVDTNKDLNTFNPLKVISLFSGCGEKDIGMIVGFNIFNSYYGKNNYEIIFSNDIIDHTCKTYK